VRATSPGFRRMRHRAAFVWLGALPRRRTCPVATLQCERRY